MSWESLSFRPSPYPRIDLHAERRDARAATLVRSCRLAALFVGIVFFGGVVLAPLIVNSLKANHRLSQLVRTSAKSERRFQSMEAANAAHEQQKASWQRYAESRTRRQEWSRLLHTIGLCAPAQVCLGNLQIGGSDAQAQIEIEGATETMAALNLFLNALTNCSEVTQVRLVETTADTTLGSGSIRFKVTMRSRRDIHFVEQPVETTDKSS